MAGRLQISYLRSPALRVERARKLLVMVSPLSAGHYIAPVTCARSGRSPRLHRAADRLDDGSAQAALALVGHRVLAGRHRPLRRAENDARGAVGARLENRRLIALAVAHLDRAGKRLAPGRGEPVPGAALERIGCEQRMVVPLHHDERVARGILGRPVPGLFGASRPAADAQARALSEGVKGKPVVLAELLAIAALDGPGALRHEALEKLPKRPLAR